MAIIKSGASTDVLTIDPVSKAGRATLYKADGTLIVPLADGGNVVVASSVLPTGAATETTQLLQATATKQDTGNTSVASIDTKTPVLVNGRQPVVLGEIGGTGFTGISAPAVATQATVTRAAAGVGVKNVCIGISVSLSSTAAATVGSVQFVLRDGASGVGTIIWTVRLSIPATAGNSANHTLSLSWIAGTPNTAMTLETVAAPAANTFATVSIVGTTST